MSVRLVAVRHAPPATAGLCYGRLDVPVAPGSVEAAELVRVRLGSLPAWEPVPPPRSWSAIYTSPSARCYDLAVELAESLGARLAVDPRLFELNFGEWEGVPWRDLAGQTAFEAWAADWTRLAPPGGEALPELEGRVRSWWEGFETSESPLLVAHAGVIRALRVLLHGVAWPEVMAQSIPHLEPLVLGPSVLSPSLPP